ncbi:hypothetical protein AKJ50_02190 [candidate division MSBL1 archaeon SCGC-AAA382A13]|uniref:DUF5615 domain-containing protein n=1 Tax=candidate division MSBL1 archaeon SCGC-AAA382A13 TaxID=1698279 RepID=A0A133VE11_9EURY|nr:hypothetical protein AKJ50_02190 [candidate division MSBL1 archaeon SCGC-AAA382A13]
MLKFLVDECTGAKVSDALSKDGFSAEYVGRIMKGARDERVLQKALEEEKILITNDKDFGEIIYRKGKPHAGVILLRLEKDFPEDRISTIRSIIEELDRETLNQKFIVASEKGVRVRP